MKRPGEQQALKRNRSDSETYVSKTTTQPLIYAYLASFWING
jgi:hypothetical protein